VSGLDSVQGHHRVAAILLSLEPSEATAIMRSMKLEVVEKVANAMLELDPRLTEAGAVDRLYGDLARQVNGPKTVQPCSAKDLESLLSQSFGAERSRSVLQDIEDRRQRERPFGAVEAYTPFEIARVLREESAAVAALVLAHLDPAQSAEIIRSLESEWAVDVVRRMATLEPPNPAILEAIAADVLTQLEEAPPVLGDSDPSARLRQVAELLNNAPTEIEKHVIESLAEDGGHQDPVHRLEGLLYRGRGERARQPELARARHGGRGTRARRRHADDGRNGLPRRDHDQHPRHDRGRGVPPEPWRRRACLLSASA